MDNNTPSASGRGASPATSAFSDHINLRVTYLRHGGNPSPPVDLGRVPLATTIAQLKTRIRQDLAEHPAPEEQRLIYQGRPLLQSGETLRQALRLDGPVGPLPYTLHIILQPRQASTPPPPPSLPQIPQTTLPPPQINAVPIRTESPMVNHLEHHHNAHLQAIVQAQAAQQMLQSQLSMLQQQMAMLNPRAGHRHDHPPDGTPATLVNGQPLNPSNSAAAAPPNIRGNFFVAPPNMPNLQAMLGEQQRQRYLAATGPLQNRPETTSTSGSQPQPDTDGSSPQPPVHGHTTIQERIGPSGERIRTVVNHGTIMNVRFAPQEAPNPATRPASAPLIPPERPSSTRPNEQMPARPLAPTVPSLNPIADILRSATPSNAVPINRHLPHPFSNWQDRGPANRGPTMAWLASSARGPEAIVFVPDHGYFTSSQDNTQSRPSDVRIDPLAPPGPGENLAARNEGAGNVQTQAVPNVEPNAAAAPVVLRQEGQAPVQGQPQGQNVGQDDLFPFILQRGWLFLRLYVFTFVLSEPGTWRRYLLLSLAVFFCLLPRENPINRAFAMARRHVDSLIGPPQAPGGVRAQGQAQDNATVPRTDQQEQQGEQGIDHNRQSEATTRAGQVRGAVNITPEEAAARLMREHREQNPNFIRDTLYRIEQALALFFASLIPGVGERQVRLRETAREQAREQQQRAEEQQRIGVAQRAADANAPAEAREEQEKSNEIRGDIEERPEKEASGSSSSVEPANNAMGGEVRARSTETASSGLDPSAS